MHKLALPSILLLAVCGCTRKPVATVPPAEASKQTASALKEPAPTEPAASSSHALDVAVPSACTSAVNLRLEQTLVDQRPQGYVENVMVCGIAQKTTVNSGGAHGSHHLITLAVQLPNAGSKMVQIAINDTLDGPISATLGQQVFAFGEGYTDSGLWVAGVHDVHCSTHTGADNGWVVVAGVKTPATCPSR